MEPQFPTIGRSISILDRLMKMYYDHHLAPAGIGWGQQFYLEYIYDHPGASQQEMVQLIRVDKATLTKSVKKLVAAGLVREESDPGDRRVKRLFVTAGGEPAARAIKDVHAQFYDALCGTLSPDERAQADAVLKKMVASLNEKIWHRMETSHDTDPHR